MLFASLKHRAIGILVGFCQTLSHFVRTALCKCHSLTNFVCPICRAPSLICSLHLTCLFYKKRKEGRVPLFVCSIRPNKCGQGWKWCLGRITFFNAVNLYLLIFRKRTSKKREAATTKLSRSSKRASAAGNALKAKGGGCSGRSGQQLWGAALCLTYCSGKMYKCVREHGFSQLSTIK